MNHQRLYKISAVILGALLMIALTAAVYFYNNKPSISANAAIRALAGKPLAAYEDIYPIVIDARGQVRLDNERFTKAIAYLQVNPSEQAIADLIYLGQQNNITISLSPEDKTKYQALASKLSNEDLGQIINKRDALFHSYKDIVNAFGQTFAGTGIEIVLHDTRNPVKSIMAVQNPISGRQLGDPNTNFGVQLIKDYSVVNMRGASYISYPLTLKDGRAVKSTTIPIFDERYGLIGFICINIDISRLKDMSPAAVNNFVRAVTKTQEQDKIIELIDNAKLAVQESTLKHKE